jgi:hypothetical protein
LEQFIVLLLSSGIYAEIWGNGIIFARQKAINHSTKKMIDPYGSYDRI